ncbi:MAG: sugar phosphate isomerase/epimerase [Pirellulales bacterium]|nr:sugar phosphate isomerase/epimerase [Pirellulales bacterium]
MKKAIVIRAFSQNTDFMGSAGFLQNEDDFARCFDSAARHGFDGVQPFVEPQGYLSLESDGARAAAVARRARSCGVELTSLEIQPFSFSLTADDVEVRRHGEQVVGQALRLAAVMELPGVLVIPGYVGLPWDPAAKPVRYDLAYERLRDALKSLSRDAERLGVAILLENVWNMFLLSPLEMRQLIDEVGSPAVGMLLDTGNVIQTGFPEQWIRILGPRIREVHLKDFRRAVGTIHGFVPLLDGDVNWPEVLAALGEIDYGGFLTAEIFPYRHFGDTALAHTSAAMDRMLARKAS